MLQLLVWYFAPYYLWQMNIGGYKLTAILLGCSLNYAAYFAEIYRAGVQSIDHGQHEAAKTLASAAGKPCASLSSSDHRPCNFRCEQRGHHAHQGYGPSDGNWCGRIAESGQGRQQPGCNPTAFFIAAVIYLALTFLLTLLSQWCEKRFSRHERKEA